MSFRAGRIAAAAGLALLASLLAGPSRGQAPDFVLESSRPGPLASPVQVARDAVEVSTSQDQTNVSVQVSRDDGGKVDLHALSFPEGTEKRSAYNAWVLTLKAPVNKKDDTTELANLDGLADAFTATFKYNHLIIWRRNPSPEALRAVCDPDNCDSGEIKKRLGQSGYDKWHNLNFAPDQLAWGALASIGTKSYEFLEAASVSKSTVHRTPWSLQAFGAWEHYKAGLFTASLRYENAYKARDSGTRCPGGASSGVVDCVTDPLGPPKKTESTVAAFEFRRSDTLSGWQVAISPSASYDFHQSVFGIDVPIYLWADKKGQLTGGFKLGWRDDKGGIDFGLFVGVPFSMSPGK